MISAARCGQLSRGKAPNSARFAVASFSSSTAWSARKAQAGPRAVKCIVRPGLAFTSMIQPSVAASRAAMSSLAKSMPRMRCRGGKSAATRAAIADTDGWSSGTW